MERDTIKGEPSTLHDAREIQRTLSAEIHVQARDPGLQEDFPSSRTSQPPSNVSKMDKVMARRPSSVLEADTPITVNHSDHINANSSRSAVGQLSDFMDQGYSVALDNANFRDELQELVTTKYRIWKKNILLVNRQKVQCLCYRSNCAADGTYVWAKCAITRHDSSTTFSVDGSSWTFAQPCEIDTASYKVLGAPAVLELEKWLNSQNAHLTCGSEGTEEGTHFDRDQRTCQSTWTAAQRKAFEESLADTSLEDCKSKFDELVLPYHPKVNCMVKAIQRKFPPSAATSMWVDPESGFDMCTKRTDLVLLPRGGTRSGNEDITQCDCKCPRPTQLGKWIPSEAVKAFTDANDLKSARECKSAISQKLREHSEEEGPLEWTREKQASCKGACNGECAVKCADVLTKQFTDLDWWRTCGGCYEPDWDRYSGTNSKCSTFPDVERYKYPSFPQPRWRNSGDNHDTLIQQTIEFTEWQTAEIRRTGTACTWEGGWKLKKNTDFVNCRSYTQTMS